MAHVAAGQQLAGVPRRRAASPRGRHRAGLRAGVHLTGTGSREVPVGRSPSHSGRSSSRPGRPVMAGCCPRPRSGRGTSNAGGAWEVFSVFEAMVVFSGVGGAVGRRCGYLGNYSRDGAARRDGGPTSRTLQRPRRRRRMASTRPPGTYSPSARTGRRGGGFGGVAGMVRRAGSDAPVDSSGGQHPPADPAEHSVQVARIRWSQGHRLP